jgi:hypothetical protein
MKNYVVHVDGIIVRYGVCSDAMFDRQAGDGQEVIEGNVTNDNQWVVDGNVVDRDVSDDERIAEVQASIRLIRDMRLTHCDWTQVADAPLTQAKKDSWKVYRQALRDVPQNSEGITSLHDTVWPVVPE